MDYVSIHAPVWVRQDDRPVTVLSNRFQFTHPCGCDPGAGRILFFHAGFNSRTRVGATWPSKIDASCGMVSIHAPVWVRPLAARRVVSTEMFQFTHPCGCDQAPRVPFQLFGGFNSRTRVGATLPVVDQRRIKGVSIHAPVWVRRCWTYTRRRWMRFQFTHPCGCDPQAVFRCQGRFGFNSRTRVGATPKMRLTPTQEAVSIHAPVWVRLDLNVVRVVDEWFQFTHPCGCDGYMEIRALHDYLVSIHAPVWVRRPDEYGLSIKHATKVLRQPDARTRCGQA